MAKVALNMDMPESCSRCKFMYEFQGIKKCQLMNALNNGASRLSQNTFTEKRHEKCPLRELPQRYQQLEEQGRLIKLPCKIGDDVWFVPSQTNYKLNILNHHREENKICHQKVARITFSRNGWYLECDKDLEYAIDHILIDKMYKETWFLTKSEADAKLKELKGGSSK